MALPVRGDIIEIKEGDIITGWVNPHTIYGRYAGKSVIRWDTFQVDEKTAKFFGRYIVVFVSEETYRDGVPSQFLAAVRQDKPTEEILFWIDDERQPRRFAGPFEHVDVIPAPKGGRNKHKESAQP